MNPLRKTPKYRAIVIGCSSGGVEALNQIFSSLGENFPLPIITVIHLSAKFNFIDRGFWSPNGMAVKEAEEKEPILPKNIYFAPPNYHLLIEDNETFSLSVEGLVHFARPSIEVTFLSAAEVYRESLIGILLTGANDDGAEGLQKIKLLGGLTIVQNPDTAKARTMPESALRLFEPDHIFELTEISQFLNALPPPTLGVS
jgi:two-component system chemotaxis response regulator CheB